MKRLMTGVLIAALLLSQTSIADVFVKTDATTVVAAEQDAESGGTELEENEPEESEEDEPDKAESEESEEDEPDKAESEESGEDEHGKAESEESEEAGDTESGETDEELWEGEIESDEGVLAVQDMIDELPSVEEVKAMDMDGQRTAYDRTQEAYDAYMSLSEEQRELITGAEVFEALFAYFNGMTAPLDSAFSGGSGTVGAPYKISSESDLREFAKNVNSGVNYDGQYFELTTDIDLGGEEKPWTPIGGTITNNYTFTGIFDGGEHTINGLYINSDDRYQGLFGFVGVGGTIKNLTIENANVTGNSSTGATGGIVGRNQGTITNCHFTGSVVGGNGAGGIAGYNWQYGDDETSGAIINCSNAGSVKGGDAAGGIAGNNPNGGTITNCSNTGSVVGENFVGGIVGDNEFTTITNCSNAGSVEATGDRYNGGSAGGIAGYSPNTAIVQNSYNVGSVKATDGSAGGIVGNNQFNGTTITNCYYLEGTAGSGIGLGEDAGESKSSTQIASGEVAWLLQNGQESQEELVWGQTLGSDDAPLLKVFEPDKAIRVWQVEFRDESKEYVKKHYANDNKTVALPSDYSTEDTDTQSFYGWTTTGDAEGDTLTEQTVITQDRVVYAVWTSKTTYKITYHTNGGTIEDAEKYASYTDGDEWDLPEPTRDGYIFDGWYEEEDFSGEPVKSITNTDIGDKEYYAKWIEEETEKTPELSLDTENEKIGGLEPGAEYDITYEDADGKSNTVTKEADEDGYIDIEDDWIGKNVKIKKAGSDSENGEQSLYIPNREPDISEEDIIITNESAGGAKDGKIGGLTPGETYQISKDGGKTWEKKTANEAGEIESLAPGSYDVRRPAGDDTLPSKPTHVDIKESGITQEETPKASVDRPNRKIKGLVPGAEYDITYTGEDGKQHTDTVTADENGNIEIEDEWTGGNIDIVKKGSGGDDIDSLPQELEMPEHEPAPSDVKTSKKAGKDGKGGSIGGLTPGETYQISKDGGETWEDVTADEDGEIKPVDAGSYDIRKKAGEDTLPSKSVHVEVAKENDGSGDDSGSGGGSTGGDGGNTGNGGSTGSDSSNTGSGGSTGGNNGGSSSGSGNGSQSSGNNSGGTGTGNNTAGGTQTGTDNTLGSTQTGTDNTSGSTQTGTDTTGGTQADTQTGTGTRNGRGNSTGTNRAGVSSSSSAGVTDNKDSSQSASADETTNSTAGESSETGEDAGQSDVSGTDGQTTGSTAQTVKAELKDGKITVEGDAVVTGTVRTAETTTKTLIVGEGAVIVTVVSDEYKGNAGVADTVAVVNAVLTPEQIQRVNDSETIEIRVDVKDISGQVSQEDKDIIEGGLAAGGTDGEETEELTLGTYIDISVYIKIGDGDWDAITRADEPIEVVVGIPEELQADGRIYYIARAHEGEYALLEDLDNEPDTITIKTGMFSTYAIVFKQMPGAGADASSGLLASLSWTAVALWSLGILVMIALAVILILGKRRKEEDS